MIPGSRVGEMSSLLERRLANRNQPATNQASLVINFNIAPELLNVFHPGLATSVQPSKEHALPTIQDQHSLLLPGTHHGPDLSLDEFCTSYNLSDAIRIKLRANGYTSAETLTFIVTPELREMGFKFGEIAALKVAMRRWSR